MRTDIMVVVRETWPIAFGDVEKNKRAIAERGWMPLSKSLLLHPTIMNTMTETMINNELERQIFPQVYLTQLKDRQYSERNGDVKFGVNVIHGNERKLNFNGGAMASHVANSIMAEYDREEARERNKVLKQRGKSTSERIASITKKMTAGKLVVEGGCFHLNEDVLDQAMKRQLEAQKKLDDNRKRDEAKYMIDCYKADRAMARNDTLDVSKWRSISDIRDYLRPLRRKDDTAMPLKRDGLETRFFQWSHRGRLQAVYEQDVHVMFEEWLEAQNAKTKASGTSRGKHKKTGSEKN